MKICAHVANIFALVAIIPTIFLEGEKKCDVAALYCGLWVEIIN